MNLGMGYDPDIDSDTTEELSSMRVLSCTHPPSAMNSQTIRDFDDDFLMDGEVCVFGNRNNMPMKAVFHNDLLALEQTELERETQEELAIFDFFGQNFDGGKQERFADEDDGGDNIKYELDREYANPEQGNLPRRRWFRTQNIGFNDIVSANIRLLKSNVNRIVTERFLIPQNREVLSIKQLLESNSAGTQKCQTGRGSKSSPFSVGDDFDFNFEPATLNYSTSDNPTSSASLFDSGVEGLPHHLSNLLVPISILDWYPNFANECTKVLADSGLINRVALARAKATMKSVFHGKGATARLKAQSEDFILKLTASSSKVEPTETRVITAKQLEDELSLKNSKTELSFRPYIVAAIMHVLRNKLALFLTSEKVLGYIDRHMEGVNTNTDDSCSIMPPKNSGGPHKKSRNNGNHYVGRRSVLIALTSIQAAQNDSDAVSNTADEYSETTTTKTIQLAKQLLTQFSRCIVCGGVIAPYQSLDACSGHSFVPQIFDNNKIYAGISLFQPHPVARALLGLIQVVGSVIACSNKTHLQPHTNGTNGTSSSQATEENRNFVVGSSVAKIFVSAVDRAETFLATVSDAACVFPNHTATTPEAQNIWQSPHFQYRLQGAIEALYCADPAELALVALYHSIWSLLEEEEGGAKSQPGGPLPLGNSKQQGVPDKLRRDRMLKSLVSVLKPANKSTQSEDSKITARRSVYHLLLSTVFYSTFWYSWGPSATGIAANSFVNVNFIWLKRTALLCKALASGGGNSSSSSGVGNITFEALYAASLSNGTVQSNKPKVGTLELPFDTRIIALSEAGSILMNTAHKFSCQQQRRCACRYCGEVIGPPTAGADSKLSNYYAYRQNLLVPQPIPQTADEDAVFESSTSKRRLVERGRSNERVAILPSQVPPIPNYVPNASITAAASPAISPMPPSVDIGSKRTREESIMVEHRTRGGRIDTDEFDFFNEETTSGQRSHSKRTWSVEPSGFGRDFVGEMPPPRHRGLPPPPPPSPSDAIGIPQQMLTTSKWKSPFGIFASTPSPPPPPPVSLQIGVEPVEQFSPQVTPVGGNGEDMLNMSFANLPPFLLNVAPKKERTSTSQENPQPVARSQQRKPDGGSLFGGQEMDSVFFHHFGVGSFVTIHLDNSSSDMDRVAQSYVQNN